MSAIVIDLKDFGVRTPEQVVRVFYELYGPEGVKAELWEIFRVCAAGKELEVSELDLDLTAVASLFDHMIALVEALFKLRLATAGRCVICGREAGVDGGG